MRRRVLLVARDSAAEAAYRDALGARGHHVAVARSDTEAVRLLLARPDVIVLDLGDPADCFAFARLRRTTGAPIVVLASGESGAPIVGADAVIRTPFASEDLVRAVEAKAATANRKASWRDRWEPMTVEQVGDAAHAARLS